MPENSSSESGPWKTSVVLRHDLAPWQRLNVTAFTVSGIAVQPGAVGKPYGDASGRSYLPMFQDPVVVYGATDEELQRTAERARSRNVVFSVFTEDLFSTFNDEDNRAAVATLATEQLRLVGIAMRCERKTADKILKGLKLIS